MRHETEQLREKDIQVNIEAISLGWWYTTCCTVGLTKITTPEERQDLLDFANNATWQTLHSRYFGAWFLNAYPTKEDAEATIATQGYPVHEFSIPALYKKKIKEKYHG